MLLDLSRFCHCSALTLKGRCTRLNVTVCQGEGCTFKRTRKEDIDSLQLAHQRLRSLDISIQVQIAKKYYDGLTPWKEEQTV